MKYFLLILALGTLCFGLWFYTQDDKVVILTETNRPTTEPAAIQRPEGITSDEPWQPIQPTPASIDKEETLEIVSEDPDLTATEPEIAREPEETADPQDDIYQPVVNFETDRIIAFYGNFYSSLMGILGEYPAPTVLKQLQAVVDEWNALDPGTRHVPAIHYIASTAQSLPQSDGTYTLRMPPNQILQAAVMGQDAGGVTFLDLQIGRADLLTEVRYLEPYLLLPHVHLAIDPEFAMDDDQIPGQKIGQVSAAEVNQVIEYLGQLVQNHSLPPKVLIVHRFTTNMVTDVDDILQIPEVTTVINMDGWGPPVLKFSTYQHVITADVVPYAGFKIFYKNDLRFPSARLVTPAEILQLQPPPVYIQYQ